MKVSIEEAARAVCGYCADPDNWQPAKKGIYPEWWHLSYYRNYNVRNACSAWALWHLAEQREQAALEGK